ncbi:MAG: hypothetical protein JWR26_4983 [Pedosphaera sp.]|nr:hypothetical protein [Pedosphaera sp.]
MKGKLFGRSTNREKKFYLPRACILLALAGISFSCPAQTNTTKSTAPKPHTIETKFEKGAELSSEEINQVVALAKKCGIPEVESIKTFRYMPSGGRGIVAKSKERISGRNISFDSVYVERAGWAIGDPDAKAKQLGAFWAEAPYIRTSRLREYELNKKTVRVELGEGIDISLADQVIPMIANRQISFESEFFRSQFEHINVSKPASISKGLYGQGYEVRYDEPRMKAILFKVENGKIVFTGIAFINVRSIWPAFAVQ